MVPTGCSGIFRPAGPVREPLRTVPPVVVQVTVYVPSLADITSIVTSTEETETQILNNDKPSENC